MQNGLLDVTDYNKPTLLSHSPGYYTHNYLPFNYDPEATCPTWLWALGEYFQNEDGSPDTLVPNILHAWFKKIVFRNTSHQKIFGLLGRRRSGKGTIGRTLTRMLGTANVAPITVNLLCNAFGLQPLLNKQLAIMWDASVTGRASNTRTAVEVMKNISGEDTFTVNRKNQPLLTDVKLQLSLFVIANEVLDLRDSTGALAGRFTFLETTKSFYGHEDPTVEEKIATELPGIFNQVMAAPEGRLQEHPRSQRIQEEFEEISSPFLAFIHEWCDVSDHDAFIPKEIMWMYYSDWAKRNNHGEPCPQTFKPRFLGCHDAIYDYRPPILTDDDIYRLRDEYRLDRKSDRRVDLVGRPRCYKGIDLKQSIKKLWDVQV
jgi:putative DNA primase/helicase